MQVKMIVSFRSLTRTDTGDRITFVDDAPTLLQPSPDVRSVRWDPLVGRLSIEAGDKQLAEVVGELRRSDSWAVNADSGEVEASASLSFAIDSGRLTGQEVAALVTADSLRLTFTPAQATLAFGISDKAGRAAG